MNRKVLLFVAIFLTIVALPITPQWLSVPAKGIPRTKDGKPDFFAPAPRKPDGKPDFSGVWELPRSSFKYLQNLAADFKSGDLPIQPWAEALTKERAAGTHAAESPAGNCLPQGIPILDASGAAGYPLKLIQQLDLIVLLYEVGPARQVYMDGRQLPKDPNPTWMGYSIGQWDGDDLVVESAGSNGKMWLDVAGHPSCGPQKLDSCLMQRSSPASIHGAIHQALPWFGERAPQEGDDDRRLSVGMVGSGLGCRDRGLCELWRDYNGPPTASVLVSDAAP